MAETNEQQTSTEQQRDDQATGATGAVASAVAHERTVLIALFRYRDPATNALRVAFRGEQIEVNASDLARGEKMGALAELDDGEVPAGPRSPVTAPRTPDQPEPSGLADPAGNVAPTGEDATDPARNLGPIDPAAQPARTGEQRDRDGDGQVDQPRKVESKARWVDYAVSAKGADRGEAEALSKDELIDRYGRD